MNARTTLILLSAFLTGPFAFATDESKVATAYIYQFTNYIDWSEAKPAPGDTFVISIVGDSALASELENLAKTKKIKDRAVEIVRTPDISKLKKSDIVVVTSSSLSTLKGVCLKTKGTGALIIGYSPGFAEQCAMVNFFVADGRLRFEINRTALKNEKLVASSQLLKLAKLVE